MAARLTCTLFFAAISAAQANQRLDCAADVGAAARQVSYALQNARMGVHFCKDGQPKQLCAMMISYSVASLGAELTSASKALEDCAGAQTQCGQDLGSVISALGSTIGQALPAANMCGQKHYLGCGVSALMPALEAFAVAENVEKSLRECVHKRDGPSMLPHTFQCVADVAIGAHDLIGTASSAVQAAELCHRGGPCEMMLGSTGAEAGLAAMSVSKAAHTCKGKDTACAGSLGQLVENLGMAALTASRTKMNCHHSHGVGCAAEVLLTSTSVLDIAKGIEGAIQGCHKNGNATVVV